MAEELKKRGRGRPKGSTKKKSIADERPNRPRTFSEVNEQKLIEQLFEEDLREKEELEKRFKGEESPYFVKDKQEVHMKREGFWDVYANEKIVYFDPELSYEKTGYRPITMTEGLDFNPDDFREAAITYLKTGAYTKFPPGCRPYDEYWDEQYRRCVEGHTVGKYRVTGEHYFFLNFYQMDVVNDEVEEGVTGQVEGFPSFLSKQYEFFHYIELCEKASKDCIMLKARGLGFSEILACIGTRPFITTRNYRTCYTTSAENQLRPVLQKCWKQLDWLNRNTNGGMKRLRQKIDNILHKRASVVNDEGIEYGRMSDIFGIVADHPRKVRGYRVHRLIFEEFGSNPHAKTSWIQGNALVELGGKKIGIRIGGGTGGDSGPQLAGLAEMFNDPIKFNVLPYKNFYTRDGKVQYTGFFIPAHEFALDKEYLDNRGVTDSDRFRKYYESYRELLDGPTLLDYCAEHCFTPDEALLRQGENIFDTVTVSDRITQLRVHKMGNTVTPMALIKDKSRGDNVPYRIKAIPSPSSKLLVVEPPILDDNGEAFKNLYVAGIDSIDMGTASSASETDVSDFCILIKKRMHGMDEPKYVAMYKDRPRDIRAAYDMSINLLEWYNCKALLEYTKISIQTYFREKRKANLFMSRPDFAISNKLKTKKGKELIGLPATETVIKHGLELIAIYINDYCYGIDFDDMLEEMLNYSYANKRKFDIIAAMGMCEIADEELTGVVPTIQNSVSREWKDFGYYIDENGYKRRGVINKNDKFTAKWRI